MVMVLVLRKEFDKAKPEKRRTARHKDQRKGRSFLEFPNDPVSVEGKAGRVANDAPRMKRNAV
jgi:hypothetical protein